MTGSDALASHPFLRGLDEARLLPLCPCAGNVRFAAGEIIFRAGEEARTLYLLRSGRVVLEEHVPGKGDVRLESLGAGDILGFSWLFPGGRWVLAARAVEETEALALDGECLRRSMAEDPALGLAIATQLIHHLYQRLGRVRLQRLDVYKADP
jgi:CRP/FNR family cyclic AMP-dependent transcriptional regulator